MMMMSSCTKNTPYCLSTTPSMDSSGLETAAAGSEAGLRSMISISGISSPKQQTVWISSTSPINRENHFFIEAHFLS